MADNNGSKKTTIKKCPFLNKECIGIECALYHELRRDMAGLQQKFGACAFSAMIIILSEMNQKADINNAMPLSKGLFKG